MNKFLSGIILTISLIFPATKAQDGGYIVEKVPFCSSLNNEFSPVFYSGGIVFCSNMRDNPIFSYRDDRTRLYKMFYVPLDSSQGKPRVFSKELTTYLNEGPASFSKDNRIIYYSRNNTDVKHIGNIFDTTNKLGIFRAEYNDGRWTGIAPFEYNDPSFSVCMPSISPEGSRIYFSSDMAGGFGGLDLYYCECEENGWGKPLNAGPSINTAGNETFPFAFYYNKLYFSSDGHPGRGGKDIYYSQEINGTWIQAVPLDSTINSHADDFGIVFDSTLEKGYFSSNRNRSDDIYSFRTPPVKFSSCDTVAENNYCFLFYDERLQKSDTVRGEYVWEFENVVQRKGTQVVHCFPGPGDYRVNLNIYDTITGDTIAEPVSYNIRVSDIEQADLRSYNSALTGKPVTFDGREVNIPGFRLTDYFWNFGEGFIPGGPVMNIPFKKSGSYNIQMGLLGKEPGSDDILKKCFMKHIRIYDSCEELERRSDAGESQPVTDIIGLPYSIFFMNDLSERQENRLRSLIRPGHQKVEFLNTGILPESSPALDNFISILKGNPEIRMDIVVHSFTGKPAGWEIDMSERWAQYISLYFENHDIGAASFSCRGNGSSGSVLKPISEDEKRQAGLIEFVFMEKILKQ